MPTTIVVDRRGQVVDRLIGPQTAARLTAELRALGAWLMPVLPAEIALSPIGLSAAFAAGVISFVSPCVWPLVPAYLSYVSGLFSELQTNAARVRPRRPPSCSASERSSPGSERERAGSAMR